MSKDSSYIKYTRALHNNRNFKSLPYQYRHIFTTILVNMAYRPMQLNDHGKLVDIQPGQLMITYRQLVKLCDEEDIDLPKVQRALKMFENIGFSIQKTIHKKTIITITESSICDSIKKDDDTGIDTKTIQKRYTKEERQEIKETTTTPLPPKSDQPSEPEIAAAVFYLCLMENKDLSNEDRITLQRYPEERVKLALDYAKHVKPTKTLMHMIIWHMTQAVPPDPYFSRSVRLTDQQQLALEINKYIKSIGEEILYLENEKLILEGNYMLFPRSGSSISVSISSTTYINDLRNDFKELKQMYAQKRKAI